jgi:hypothetical protein
MVESLKREARGSIDEQVQRFEVELETFTRRLVARTVRAFAAGAAAASLVSAGLILSLYGTATFLGQFTPPGVSWVIIGVIGTAVGALFLLRVRR